VYVAVSEMWGMFPTFFYSSPLARCSVNDRLESIVTQELTALDVELVELRVGGTTARRLVEVRIDNRNGAPVTVEDCARVSRALERRLDEGGWSERGSSNYVLQVSSPGDRPLRTMEDWRRFVGRWANVLSPEYGGRFEGVIVGLEDEAGIGVVVLKPERGEARRVPLVSIKEARLAFHI